MKARLALLNSVFLLLVALAGSMLLRVHPAAAQTIVAPSPVTACTSLSYNLRHGQYDGYAVTALQAYLNASGYMSYPPTGYFGPITLAAVLRFQAANGIDTTGFVGPITRGRIQALSCGTVPNPTPSGVAVYGISPSFGPIGTTVTITGTGFLAMDNVVRIGAGAMYGLPAYGPAGGTQTITFALPESLGQYCPSGTYCIMIARLLSPGSYPVSVTNAAGTSNSVNFTVTAATPGPAQQLSISGINAPSTLPINTPGTWTVRVASSSGGMIRYSVLWGDEASYSSGAPIIAPPPSTVQTSATFTHAYARTGTYSPRFTVTDDFGHSVSVSTNVVVTPLY